MKRPTAFLELESLCAPMKSCVSGTRIRYSGVVVNGLDKLASFFRNYPDMKPRIPSVLITFALVCFALSPKVQAVVPAPDGGYPNFNTAEGQNALFSLTTGSADTAVGWFSLKSNTAGSFNTATGAGTLLFNTADANTAFGAASILFNTTGVNGTAVGAAALFKQYRRR
jgi:hypothetical protein